MRIIIVDTNIVFSAVLNAGSNIGEILFNNNELLEFYSPEFLRTEIDNHREKLLDLSGISGSDINEVIFHVFQKIHFISDAQIPMNIWVESAPLVREIDMDDLPFVALTKYLDGILWTGDQKLLKGLKAKGFQACISTPELLEWLQDNLE